MLAILRKITHIIFPVKRAQYKFIKRYAKKIENKKILEIGAGEGYKVEKFFPITNEYIKTDLVEYNGVFKLDITKEKLEPMYDVIICLNVLEHIFDFQVALDNIYNGLKDEGFLFLSVPMFYPLHMLPDDYWRFTPFTLEKLLNNYRKVMIQTNGLNYYPFNINILAIK
ncbi:MAG TPA: methyltransferase domain-containing protein [candidate division Zixibacteria bacterium]|nr:methyltransferase domain-containing protein [candidate division Zixibacteria bacterium]